MNIVESWRRYDVGEQMIPYNMWIKIVDMWITSVDNLFVRKWGVDCEYLNCHGWQIKRKIFKKGNR